MQTKNKEIKQIPLSFIEPDENQPRRNFNAARLNDLKQSILKHGILNPLIVEQRKGAKYLLVDGERRYRAAKELKLKEVPAIVVGQQLEQDRLIQQFHIQEQHEGWTAVEKANAVDRLAKSMKLSINQIGDLLNIPPRTIGEYVAFSELAEKKSFEKNEIPITYARHIGSVKNKARDLYERILEKEFDREIEKKFEQAIISRIISGVIKKPQDIIKLKDAIVADPKNIDTFIKSDVSTTKLFLDSKAQSAYYYRQVCNNINFMVNYLMRGKENNFYSYFSEEIPYNTQIKSRIKRLLKELENLDSKIS